jgi:hypothetical protein
MFHLLFHLDIRPKVVDMVKSKHSFQNIQLVLVLELVLGLVQE